jgi:hypothetical protein
MHETHPEFAPELLRCITQKIGQEAGEVSLQSHTFAAKLIAPGSESQVPLGLAKICERDREFEVLAPPPPVLEIGNWKIESSLRELLITPGKPLN